MFNNKRITALEKIVLSREESYYLDITGRMHTVYGYKGVQHKMDDLFKEIEKLKAIVAEVTNTVYKDNK